MRSNLHLHHTDVSCESGTSSLQPKTLHPTVLLLCETQRVGHSTGSMLTLLGGSHYV